jgi:CO/xanthine dehydrogenase FAD-binding subunit
VLKQLKGIASQQIRNVATIGGNIMTNRSGSCLFPILSAIVRLFFYKKNTKVVILSINSKKEILLSKLFKNGLNNDEILEKFCKPFQ